MNPTVNIWSSKTDAELRPWAANPAQEQLLREAEAEFTELYNMTAHSRNCGATGSSILDCRPPELLAVDERFALEETCIPDQSCTTLTIEETVTEAPAEPKAQEQTETIVKSPEEKPIQSQPERGGIKSIAYSKRQGPAIANISTSDYKKLMVRLHTVDMLLSKYCINKCI